MWAMTSATRTPAPPAPDPPEDGSDDGRGWVVGLAAALVFVLFVVFAWLYVHDGGTDSSTSIDLSHVDPNGAGVSSASTPTTVAPSQASTADRAAADQLVRTARQAAATYADPAATAAAGYRASARSLAGRRVGSVRYLIDPAHVDGRVDPSHPDGLMYERTADGEQLVGVLFLGVGSQHPAEPGGPLTPWYATALRTRGGAVVDVLPVWFGDGVVHPFALTWFGATH
jgi:hypothetical protein